MAPIGVNKSAPQILGLHLELSLRSPVRLSERSIAVNGLTKTRLGSLHREHGQTPVELRLSVANTCVTNICVVNIGVIIVRCAQETSQRKRELVLRHDESFLV